MVNTDDLIDQLVTQASPVRRLRHPGIRAGVWLALAAALIVALSLQHGLRADLTVRLQESWFSIGLAASTLTGALAALAAFMVSLPDRSRAWLLLPVPATIVWLATVSAGCFANWVSIGPERVQLGEAASCFATLVLAAVPLSVAMFWMLRHAALLRPTPAVVVGGVSIAALTATALSLLHSFEASAMILMWNFGTVPLVIAADAVIARRILRPAQ
jgi:hypothetical protein